MDTLVVMTDTRELVKLVERLRRLNAYGCCTEAADTIESLTARLAAAEKAIRDHNDACQDLCGRGDQEAVRCQYRPYFVATGRRCTECPTEWIIDVPDAAIDAAIADAARSEGEKP